MKFIKDNFLSFVILVLVATLFADRCNKPLDPVKPIVIRDTVWMRHDSIIQSKPQLINTVTVNATKEYLPDTNYHRLLQQYNKLVSLYLEKNIYRDSIRLDSIGYINVRDTISNNRITDRIYKYDLKYPIIKETVIAPAVVKNQLYIGGSLQGSATGFNQIGAGLLLKNRRDQIFGVYTGIDSRGQVQTGVQGYWKIRVKK